MGLLDVSKLWQIKYVISKWDPFQIQSNLIRVSTLQMCFSSYNDQALRKLIEMKKKHGPLHTFFPHIIRYLKNSMTYNKLTKYL